MKEIKMDWEIYQLDINKAKKDGGEMALWRVARWIEGQETLSQCLFFAPEHKEGFERISLALGREDELIKKEKEE